MKRNLFISAILMICFAAAVINIHAQRIDPQPRISSLVKIENYDWYSQSEISEPRFVKNSYRRDQPEGKSANIPADDPSESKKTEKFVYRIRVHNLTDREISAVVWRYQFFNPLTGALAASLEFENNVRIKPNRRKTLYAESLSLPAPAVDVRLFEFNPKRPFRETAVVESLVFAAVSEKKKGGKK